MMNKELFTESFRRIIVRYMLETRAPSFEMAVQELIARGYENWRQETDFSAPWTADKIIDEALYDESKGNFPVWFARMLGQETGGY